MRLPPKLGIRREILILLPASLLLLVAISSFTLLSYRSGIGRLEQDQRDLAIRLASELAGAIDRLQAPTDADLARSSELLRALPAGVALVDGSGATLAASGRRDLRQIPPPRPLTEVVSLGPRETELPLVIAFAPLSRGRAVRVDLAADTLAAQLRTVRLLTVVVLPVDVALVLLVLFALQQLIGPWERLLAHAAQGGAARTPDQDEVEFLTATFERAMAALASSAEPAPEDDLEALERTLAPSLQSGLLLLGKGGEVLSLNALGAELLAVEPTVEGEPFDRLLAERPALRATLALALGERRGVLREELDLELPGRRVTLGLTIHPLRRADGDVRGYLVLFADLTEVRKRSEQERLAAGLSQLGEMAAGLAHELRNGLATIRGYLTLIDRRASGEPIEEDLAEVRREAGHLERVVADFLAFARPGSARLEPVAVDDLLARLAVDPALDGFAVAIEGERGCRVHGDEPLLVRALRNLALNAVQAERGAGREGPLEVAVTADRDTIEIAIADRGPGVPAPLRERLFQPFATGRADGVGLGLALAHRIASLHGGSLSLGDREGGGTIARMILRRASREPAPDSP